MMQELIITNEVRQKDYKTTLQSLLKNILNNKTLDWSLLEMANLHNSIKSLIENVKTVPEYENYIESLLLFKLYIQEFRNRFSDKLMDILNKQILYLISSLKNENTDPEYDIYVTNMRLFKSHIQDFRNEFSNELTNMLDKQIRYFEFYI